MASIKEIYESKKSENLWIGSIIEKKERTRTEGEATHMENSTTPKTLESGVSFLDLYKDGVLDIKEYTKNLPEGLESESI